MSEPASRLTLLQALRGAAALAVVLCHVGTVLRDPFGGVLRVGHAGVDVFFVLSGYIITTVHGAELGCPACLARYAWRRLARIYPIYWIATLMALGLSARGMIALGPVTAAHLARSLLLLPAHQAPVLGAAWTLSHEMMFYAAFGLAIAHRRAGLGLLALWIAFILVLLPRAAATDPWAPADLLTGFVGSSYNLQFALGVGVATIVPRMPRTSPALLIALGMGGLVLTGVAEAGGQVAYLGESGQALYGLSAALLIWGLVAAEQSGGRAGRLPVMLGDASYAIYLIHAPLVMAAGSLGVVTALPHLLGAALLAAIGLGGGIVLHGVVERPVLRALRRPNFAWARLLPRPR